MRLFLTVSSVLLLLPLMAAAQPAQNIQDRAVSELDATLFRTLEVQGATASANDALVRGGASTTTAAPSARTIDLQALRSRVGAVRDIQFVGRDRAASVPADGTSLALAPGELIAVRRDAPAERVELDDGGTQTLSSTILYQVDSSGSARELGLIHKATELTWDFNSDTYVGQLLVGVVDREDVRSAAPLGTSIPVQLLAVGGTLDTDQVEVSRLGVPYETVNVTVPFPDQPYSIALLSQIDADLPSASMEVVRPQLRLSGPEDLQGFGVESGEITISPIGTRLREGQRITVSLNNGWLAERELEVTPGGTASTAIRSRWLGAGTVRVVEPSVYSAEPLEIRYAFPFRFLVAALIGGALGAIVPVYTMKNAKPGEARSFGLDWAVGLIIGFGATTMAYAGMRLPEWIPVPSVLVGEVAPFALSFICAAAGTAVIGSILPRSSQPRGD